MSPAGTYKPLNYKELIQDLPQIVGLKVINTIARSADYVVQERNYGDNPRHRYDCYLHKIEVARQSLKKIGVNHEKVKCFKTMSEFRMVNNAIKHERYGLSTSITTQIQRKYDSKQLGGMYANRAKHLETYLSDIYRRVAKA